MRPTLLISLAASFLGLGLLGGCGGGGSATVPTPGGGQNLSVGLIQAQCSTKLTHAPLVQTSGPTTFVAIAGASFTAVSYTPAPTLSNTRIAYAAANGNLWTIDMLGLNPFQVSTDLRVGDVYPCWSPDATQLCFLGPPFNYGFYTIGADGLGEKLILPNPNPPQLDSPSWSPDKTKIAFSMTDPVSGFSQIFTMTPFGTSLHRVTDGTGHVSNPSWSPNGATIAFLNIQDRNVYTVSSSGGSVHQVTTFGGLLDPVLSPDGKRFVATWYTATHYQVVTFGMDGNLIQVTNDAVDDSHPTWSPDSRMIAYQRDTGQNAQITVCLPDGSNQGGVIAGFRPSWSPFPGRRVLVGAGALFGTPISGFLFSQTTDTLTSFVTFDAPTPSGVIITPQESGAGAQNQAYVISGGGGLKSLKYTNDTLGPPIIILLSTTAVATGAVVSLNTATGHVSLVVPYTKMARVSGSQKVGTLEYAGSFSGIWDGKGKNLAPGGASRIEIARKTGELVSFTH